MVRKLRQIGRLGGALVASACAVTGALAALPPYWQSAREIEAIVNDARVHDALKYEEPILSVTTTGDDVYELRTARCRVTVTIVDAPQAEGMVGPRQFELEVGQAVCE
jgi:hypothetical protein